MFLRARIHQVLARLCSPAVFYMQGQEKSSSLTRHSSTFAFALNALPRPSAITWWGIHPAQHLAQPTSHQGPCNEQHRCCDTTGLVEHSLSPNPELCPIRVLIPECSALTYRRQKQPVDAYIRTQTASAGEEEREGSSPPCVLLLVDQSRLHGCSTYRAVGHRLNPAELMKEIGP